MILCCRDNTVERGGGLNSTGGMLNAEINMDSNVVTPSTVLATPGLNNAAWNRQQAVSVRHAFKQYGSSKNPNHVLQNLNMTVAKGSMYVNC